MKLLRGVEMVVVLVTGVVGVTVVEERVVGVLEDKEIGVRVRVAGAVELE